MITKFSDKIFFFNCIIKWIYAVFAYIISFGVSNVLILNRIEVVSDFHFKEFVSQFEMIKNTLVVLDLSLIYCVINIIGFIGNSFFASYREMKGVIENATFNSKNILDVESRLDESNSFLYSNKTVALLE